MADRSDIEVMFALIQRAYGRYQFRTDDLAVDLWAEMLRDIPSADALAALKACIARNDWPPSIAQVRQAAADRADPIPSTDAVVAMVEKSMMEYGEGHDPTLPEFVTKIVEAIGRRSIYHSMMEHRPSALATVRRAAEAAAKQRRDDRDNGGLFGPGYGPMLPGGGGE